MKEPLAVSPTTPQISNNSSRIEIILAARNIPVCKACDNKPRFDLAAKN